MDQVLFLLFEISAIAPSEKRQACEQVSVSWVRSGEEAKETKDQFCFIYSCKHTDTLFCCDAELI